jgi:nitric oxide reductase large subunit
MDVYAQIAVKIIKSQEAIIGPVAVEQAQRVPHLKVDWEHEKVTVSGNEASAITALIEVYKELFGQISVEVSKEAASSLVGQLSAGGLPEALK